MVRLVTDKQDDHYTPPPQGNVCCHHTCFLANRRRRVEFSTVPLGLQGRDGHLAAILPAEPHQKEGLSQVILDVPSGRDRQSIRPLPVM